MDLTGKFGYNNTEVRTCLQGYSIVLFNYDICKDFEQSKSSLQVRSCNFQNNDPFENFGDPNFQPLLYPVMLMVKGPVKCLPCFIHFLSSNRA